MTDWLIIGLCTEGGTQEVGKGTVKEGSRHSTGTKTKINGRVMSLKGARLLRFILVSKL